MFVPFDEGWPPPPRWEPERPRPPKLSAREQRALTWLVGMNLLMLFLAPIAGASVVDAVLALFE